MTSKAMGIYTFNPLHDPRWSEFIGRHPESSVFHSVPWLKALNGTYGYEPVVYTTDQPEQPLTNGLLFCEVRSWLSGTRLVSLPFSDHCQPLADHRSMSEILGWMTTAGRREWKYVEFRPIRGDSSVSKLGSFESFSLQLLDLRPDIGTLFKSFHKSCVQRKIQRAEREGLTYEQGSSEQHLAKFYDLLLLTRRRHGLPPQPRMWFRNVLACLGDRALVRIASRGSEPIASMITIQHKNTLVYKYGCSNSRFNNLGGNALLFWKAIQDAKANGITSFDFGRSETANSGLVSFKENWGAKSVPLDYYRFPVCKPLRAAWPARVAKNVFAIMPDPLLAATGKLLYRHIG
jgi:CelD/BcsL family acetyltransferase involved in cellulose biosynthesis